MTDFIKNTRIILVNPSHPGNIGSVARAMKNMGFNKLYIVSNNQHYLSGEARARAGHAVDLLEQATQRVSLESALAECKLIFGCSGRTPDLPLPCLDPKELAECLLKQAYQNTQNAIVLGCERVGLSVKDLALCHYQVKIPAHQDYVSLNLSHALQIIVYECFCLQNNAKKHSIQENVEADLATFEEMSYFYEHLERVITKTKFYDPKNPGRLLPRLRLLFNRVLMSAKEVNMLRGFLTSIEEFYKTKMKNSTKL